MTETQAETTQTRGARKVRVGRVISDRMDKTVVVQVSTLKRHRLYKKTMQNQVRFKAHDENNECKIGDLVQITETRPISKDKRWRVSQVIEKAR